MGIEVVFSVSVIGRVNQVVPGLMARIVSSGLYDQSDRVWLVINGDPGDLDHSGFHEVAEGLPKFVPVTAWPDASKCEFPALRVAWDRSRDAGATVCYIHSKGVTRQPNQQMADWTEYLSHFTIDRWRDRLADLEGHDCTGVNLGGSPADLSESPATWGYGKAPLHYSGNFWWSRSSHLAGLPDPMAWPPDGNYLRWRVMAEMWLCQLPGARYHCAWRSGVDHYAQAYPPKMYREDATQTP